MDYININSVSVPYPNGFTMKKEANITAEITTLTGKTVADVNGWKYANTSLKWDTLKETLLQEMLDEVMEPFTITFKDPLDGIVTVNAFLRSQISTKTRYKDGTSWVWKDVTLEVSFPDVYDQ